MSQPGANVLTPNLTIRHGPGEFKYYDYLNGAIGNSTILRNTTIQFKH